MTILLLWMMFFGFIPLKAAWDTYMEWSGCGKDDNLEMPLPTR
jgi:hypothetical protein